MKGRKTFISYKFADSNVLRLSPFSISTVRDYVNILQSKLIRTPHIFKAEEDGTDLSMFKDSTIQSHLKNKIYDSSVTIVLISPGMKDVYVSEKDQWIPWEIAYSLRNDSRNGRQSQSNGLLAVVIPDRMGSYDYAIRSNPICNSRTIMTNSFFEIIGSNMFNRKIPDTYECNGSTIHNGESSYMKIVKWEDLVATSNSVTRYVENAYQLSLKIDDFVIQRQISKSAVLI